jgi:hypothetical protein
MSRYLGRIAAVALSIGVVSLGLAYAIGGRDLIRLLHDRGAFMARSCGDGDVKVGDSERHLAWTGDSIDIALPATVRFRAGEGSDIVLRGAPDAIARVELRGGHLTLNCRWTASARDMEVTLPGQTIRRLGISGSGRVDMDKLSQRELTLSISGSGSLRARGEVDRLTVKLAGSGDARLGELIAKRLTVEISGSGNVEAAPQDDAHIRIAGSGNVRLLTRPARLQTHVSGSGRISQPQEAAEGRR